MSAMGWGSALGCGPLQRPGLRGRTASFNDQATVETPDQLTRRRLAQIQRPWTGRTARLTPATGQARQKRIRRPFVVLRRFWIGARTSSSLGSPVQLLAVRPATLRAVASDGC